jgi:hypothetical protein
VISFSPSRRTPRRLAGLIVAGTAAVSLLAAPALTSGASAASSTTTTGHTMVFGTSGLGNRTDLENLEARVGRKMAIARVYVSWDTPFPTSYHTWLKASGHTSMISILPRMRNNTPVHWRTIANAQPGSAVYAQIAGWADRIKAYGVKTYVAFNHEPESKWNTDQGNSADFVAAFQKFVTVFRQRGATNAIPTWIMTAFSFRSKPADSRAAAHWYPGDAYVGAMGADAYNNYRCDGNTLGWTTLASRIEAFRQFGLAHPGKDLWLPEYGSTEDPANHAHKAQWITDVENLFKQPGYQQFRGALYFDKLRAGTTCEWYVDSTPASLTAYTAMAHDPFYAGTP